jgi:hypothetical protein
MEKMENKPFPVKYCLDCKRTYEIVENEIWYHIDFPTRGLERETCCNCDE